MVYICTDRYNVKQGSHTSPKYLCFQHHIQELLFGLGCRYFTLWENLKHSRRAYLEKATHELARLIILRQSGSRNSRRPVEMPTPESK